MTTVPVGEILATLGALLALIGFIMAGIASRRLTLARNRIESIETRLNLPADAGPDSSAEDVRWRHSEVATPTVCPKMRRHHSLLCPKCRRR